MVMTTGVPPGDCRRRDPLGMVAIVVLLAVIVGAPGGSDYVNGPDKRAPRSVSFGTAPASRTPRLRRSPPGA